MIELPIEFELPAPWTGKKNFKASAVAPVNFLVGPNGSGKSRFAKELKSRLPTRGNGARLLNTDRLEGMESTKAFRNSFGDRFGNGFDKTHFEIFKNAGTQEGSGLDAFILLEERLDLRIQVEATLSNLFNRRISLEWDSGRLKAMAAIGTSGASYRLDRDECHGIKELLVLLTHLYNNEHPYLIIDEPELNLHPQYQAFLMQEVRRLAGNPATDPSKKLIFLITHSPFILDFATVEDVKAVISFDLKHEVPRQLLDLSAEESGRLARLVPRLNVHHKQLFFSDNPVFVEGILDAQMVATVQSARGVSMAAAGSCVIDAGGNEEVNQYLDLCSHLGKRAFFLYDLDSLFRGNLRARIRGDAGVKAALTASGLGADFGTYCGALESKLTVIADQLLGIAIPPAALSELIAFLTSLGIRKEWTPDKHPKARVAILTALSRFRADLVAATSAGDVDDIEGRLRRICDVLRGQNVLLLPGGTLERYLPSYTGNPYKIDDEAKSAAVVAEITWLAGQHEQAALKARYGDLYESIEALPSKPPVDMDSVLIEYLSAFIHALQGAVVANSDWKHEELGKYLEIKQPASAKVFSVASLVRNAPDKFRCAVEVMPMLGQGLRHVIVTEATNAGMRNFLIGTGKPA
ncbi:MAG TPA: AAA family ATPase [Solimonas sp.]|nr:AAA family ATPase [Solimonas sp.]